MAVRGGSQRNKVDIEVDGEIIRAFYRSPSVDEYQAYKIKNVELKGSGKVKNRLSKTNIEYAHKLLVDIRVGDFEIQEGTRWVALNPEKHSDWKAVMKTKFFALLDIAGARIFNPGDDVETGATDDEESDDAGDEDPEKS